MAVSFRIPKKKQPSDSCSLDMQSPLSRLQDDNSQKSQWGSVTFNGRTPHKTSSNENMLSKGSQRTDSLRGATRGRFSFKMNQQPIKISPARVNGTPHKVSDTSGFRPQCQTPTTAPDFTAINRWRPKRASDRLLSHDENHTKASECSAFKIHRGLDSEELEEEETEGTQGHSQVKETQRATSSEDYKVTSAASVFEKATSKHKNGTEKAVSKPFNHSGLHVQEAPARHLRTSEERAASSVPVRKDPLTSETAENKSKDPFASFYSSKLRRKPQSFCKTYKRTKPSSTEPIVLSSDDEGANEVNDVSGGLQEQRISEGIRDTQTGNQKSSKTNVGGERSTTKVEVPSIMELEFSRLHYDTIQAEANGTVVITDEGISIPLKDADGEGEVAISISCSQLQMYGMWDGGLASDGSLLSSTEEPAPSLFFLMVSDAQARLLRKELSLQYNTHTSGQACPFVLLVLSGQLDDLRVALLASLMDVIGLRYAQDSLSNPVSWADGLSRLLCHPRGEHFLSLLGQHCKDMGQDKAKENASGIKEPTARRPLRSHSKPQSLPRRYLLLERADKDIAERSHIFSSFFYKQLTRKDTSGPEETGSTSAYRRHQRVRTWTRHVDIFSKDYLFIPVNHEAHWYLVLICFPALERPQIVEWRQKSSVSQDESQTTKERPSGESQRESSQQPKGNPSKINESRSHNLPNPVVDFALPLRLDQWFPRSQVRKKREDLRELVLLLYRRQTEPRAT